MLLIQRLADPQSHQSQTNQPDTSHHDFIFQTPRGVSVVSRVPTVASFDDFLSILLHKCMSTDHMDRAYMGNLLLNPGEIMYIVYNGRILDRYEYKKLLSTTSNPNNNLQTLEPQQHYVQLKFRLLGGIDRQNRVGSKFGGGGVSSAQHSERERKERLRQLALETVDLAKDPYLMRNHDNSCCVYNYLYNPTRIHNALCA